MYKIWVHAARIQAKHGLLIAAQEHHWPKSHHLTTRDNCFRMKTRNKDIAGKQLYFRVLVTAIVCSQVVPSCFVQLQSFAAPGEG
jgi:hypothetical protein